MKHCKWNRFLVLFPDKTFQPYLNMFCSVYASFCDFLLFGSGFFSYFFFSYTFSSSGFSWYFLFQYCLLDSGSLYYLSLAPCIFWFQVHLIFLFSVIILSFSFSHFSVHFLYAQCILVLKIMLGSRELLSDLCNILILYDFPVTAMNQILTKLLSLWLTFFQFHLCYVSRTEKHIGFPKVKLKCSY